jgi:hypothetical protein
MGFMVFLNLLTSQSLFSFVCFWEDLCPRESGCWSFRGRREISAVPGIGKLWIMNGKGLFLMRETRRTYPDLCRVASSMAVSMAIKLARSFVGEEGDEEPEQEDIIVAFANLRRGLHWVDGGLMGSLLRMGSAMRERERERRDSLLDRGNMIKQTQL